MQKEKIEIETELSELIGKLKDFGVIEGETVNGITVLKWTQIIAPDRE